MAQIQFSKGIDEGVPDVRLTRSRMAAMALQRFISKTQVLSSNEEITGMYMIDEEGEIVTRSQGQICQW